MKDFLDSRIKRSWKTTVIGFLLVTVGIVAIFTKDWSALETITLVGAGVALIAVDEKPVK